MASFGDLNRVNTNIQSLDSQLSLNSINKQMSENQLKMSTGKRINRAEDDSAGFSIATKLRSRVGGLNQAMQNVGDAKSVLDITESSFGSVMDSLVEMKGLATQAANDTLGEDERGFIGEQIKELGADINDIADQTVFQGYDLLSGDDTTATKSGSLELTFQVGEREADTITADLKAVNVGELFADGTNTAQLGNS
ncbi:flagellin, partial [Fodinibius halophilus]|nr:flagellin [Fodinibius halophilus]